MAVTVETSPTFIQANSFSAELTRRMSMSPTLQRGASIGSVVGGLVGTVAGIPDLQVTYGGSGLGLAIAAGEVVVPGSSSSTQSGYLLRVTTAGSLTPAAASGANPRIDLVYAQVQDAAYTGATNLGTVAIATGTPTGGASLSNLSGAPAVPTSAIAIAYILIPQSASTISNSDILNEYTMAYFGPNIFNATPTSTSGTASSGQHVIVSANSPTITLPVPFKNARVKVTNYGSGIPVVSHNASEAIYGLGLGNSGSSSFSLGTVGATATMESDGTSWYVTAGNADSGWTSSPITMASGWSNSSFKVRKIGNMLVAQGEINAGSSSKGSQAFTLASGWYPSSGGIFGGLADDFANWATASGNGGTGAFTIEWSTGSTFIFMLGLQMTLD